MPMHVITITSISNEKKVINTGDTFGTDAKGNRLPPHEVQEIARDIGWDTFGYSLQSVTCVKPKHSS